MPYSILFQVYIMTGYFQLSTKSFFNFAYYFTKFNFFKIHILSKYSVFFQCFTNQTFLVYLLIVFVLFLVHKELEIKSRLSNLDTVLFDLFLAYVYIIDSRAIKLSLLMTALFYSITKTTHSIFPLF